MMCLDKTCPHFLRKIRNQLPMHKNILGLLVVCALLCLIACDDEASSNENISPSAIASSSEIGVCANENEGAMVYVVDSAAVYYCASGEWKILKGENGKNGVDGTDGANGIDGIDGDDGLNGTKSVFILKRVITIDTMVLDNRDTVYYLDTLMQLDTIIALNTLRSVDTLVVCNKDTVVVIDTLVGLDGKGCSATDTINAEGLAGINIDCSNVRVMTAWNGGSGANGKSAYEIAVENGYVGTEKEWLKSLSRITKKSWSYLNSDVFYGEMVDLRDNQIYKTVTIKNQIWMAENLNFRYVQKTSTLDSSSFCFNNVADSCSKYGRLYLWSAAMDSAAVFSESGKDCGYGTTCTASDTSIGTASFKGICPNGWHLPSASEWDTLITAVGGTEKAGIYLKSNSLWPSSGNGINNYGFTILPGGERGCDGDYSENNIAYFWSSSEASETSATGHYYVFDTYSDQESNSYKCSAYAIRCIKDTDDAE